MRALVPELPPSCRNKSRATGRPIEKVYSFSAIDSDIEKVVNDIMERHTSTQAAMSSPGIHAVADQLRPDTTYAGMQDAKQDDPCSRITDSRSKNLEPVKTMWKPTERGSN